MGGGGGGSDGAVNDMSPRPCTCTCVQGSENYPSAVQEIPTMAADKCTVALCVSVSVVKQRRLDLIDKLQLRGSTVFCTSIPSICQAPQRACQHPCPKRHVMLCHCQQKTCRRW